MALIKNKIPQSLRLPLAVLGLSVVVLLLGSWGLSAQQQPPAARHLSQASPGTSTSATTSGAPLRAGDTFPASYYGDATSTKVLDEYDARLAAHDPTGARSILEAGLATCPQCYLLHEQMAQVHFSDAIESSNRSDLLAAQSEALTAINEEIQSTFPVRLDSLAVFGQASAQLGDRNALSRIFQIVLTRNPIAQVYVDYAQDLAVLSDPQTEAMFQKAVALNPGIGIDPYGEWLLDHHREEDVLKLTAGPISVYYDHFLRGVAFDRLGQSDAALTEYEKYQDSASGRVPTSEVFPAPIRFRIPGSRAQAAAGIRFDDQPQTSTQGALPTDTTDTVIAGLAFLISGEAPNEPRGTKRGVGWEVRNRVLRGGVELPTTGARCPAATNSGTTAVAQYISVMCASNQFQGLHANCPSWCADRTCTPKNAPSPETSAVAKAIYYGLEPDPVGNICPGGYATTVTDNCDWHTMCNGDLTSYSLSGALFNYGLSQCPVYTATDQCMRSETKVGFTCGGATCFYNNYLVVNPLTPSNYLSQNAAFNNTPIPLDGFTLSDVNLSGYVPYQSTESLRLDVQLRRLAEYGGQFDDGTPRTQGPTQSSALAISKTATIQVHGLIDDTYHWRARLSAESGNAGPWMNFQDLPTSQVDFQVQTACHASAPGVGANAGSCGGAALSVSIAGTGTGQVVSNPAGISCPGTCSTIFTPLGTQVVLSPIPSPGSTFAGWSGDAACATGTITMNNNYSCTATFTASAAAYTLTVAHNGAGTITTSDGGINCGGTCSQVYVAGSAVTLDAAAASGWSFSSWSGACSGGPVDQFTMTGNVICTANFVLNPQPTPVTTTGSATSVLATSAQLNGTINPENFAAQAYFEYGPDPNLGYTTPFIPYGPGNNMFFPYGQPVTGLACNTTYRFRAVGVGAGGDYRATYNTFTTAPCPPAPCYPLNAIPNAGGPAPVPAPLNSPGCPNGQYHAGDHIALTALQVPGQLVIGWGGTDNDASTATTNTMTMNFPYNRDVYVIYQPICYQLILTYSGQGTAPVLANPIGYCPPGYFPWGSQATITASPATGWIVGGWSGTVDDTSTSTTNYVLMPASSYSVNVQYLPLQSSLEIFPSGSGSGSIVSDLPGIDCGLVCRAWYPYGTTVHLTATPAVGSSFGGWSGDCTGGVVNFPPGAICYPTFNLAAYSFYTVSPCRLVDTRIPTDPNGPALSGGEGRTLVFIGHCGIPQTATAVSMNVTVVNPTASGYFSVYTDIGVPPTTSLLNFVPGQVRSNNAIVGLNALGGMTVFAGMGSGTLDYIVDVNGYFQ